MVERVIVERRVEMKHWRILKIGNDTLMFWSVKEEMLRLSPGCLVDLATTFEDGQELMLMYTYDVVIADFGSSVAFDLATLIAGREVPVVAISQNGLPVHLSDMGVACLVPSESPEKAGLTALRLLRHQGLLHLGHICRNFLTWPSRILLWLVPKKARLANSYAKLLFY